MYRLRYCFKIAVGIVSIIVTCIGWPGNANAQKIVYQSVRDNDHRIYALDVTSRQQINLTSGLSGSGYGPRWSPDGSQAVFYFDPSGGSSGTIRPQGDIYKVNADGSGLIRLTDGSGMDSAPSWSPDGTRILFVSERNGGVAQTYAMDADGDGIRQLTHSAAGADAPRWSPDGSQILFLNLQDQEIYVMQADGSNPTNVTRQWPCACALANPQWSPDGSSIVFVKHTTGRAEINRIDADGTDLTYLSGANRGDHTPSWSADGTRIAFMSRTGAPGPIRFNDPAVWVMNADGSNLSNLTGDDGGFSPQWSPDGSRILFESDRDGQGDIYVMNPDGSNQTRLTSFAGDDTGFHAFGDFSSGSPTIYEDGIVLANLAPAIGTVSPLSIVSVFGIDFSKENVLFPELTSAGEVAKELAGVCFEVAGRRAPVFAVTPAQGNLQIPADSPLGPVSVVAVRNCDAPFETRSPAELITVEAATPAFFLYPPYIADGWIAARFNSDWAIVAPDGIFVDQSGPSRPASPGDNIALYGTGWGATTAGLSAGERAAGPADLLPGANPIVSFGGMELAPEDVLYIGTAPGAAGLYQLNIRVPAGAQPGPNEIVLTVYGKSTPLGPILPVASR